MDKWFFHFVKKLLVTYLLRQWKTKTIAAQELIPGDLVMLEAGNVVPGVFFMVE